MAEERSLESVLHLADFNKHNSVRPGDVLTPPPLSHQLGPTPPPAHLGRTPPPPAIQVHVTGSVQTPPPAHMRDRNSPGLQLLGHITASPQLHIHGTPSPHSSNSPATGLLMTDRPASRDYSVTPPRDQVFSHSNAGIPPELMRVLRPGIQMPVSSAAQLMLPNGSGLSPLTSLQNTYQQQQAINNHIHQLNMLQNPPEPLHINNNNNLGLGQPNFRTNHIPAPGPSPHQELKMLANIASSELHELHTKQQEREAERQRQLLANQHSYAATRYPPSKESGSKSKSPHSLRIQNLNNFPSSTMYSSSSYKSKSIAMQRARATCITNSAKSLDILRQVVQKSINDELHTIIERYISEFFRPALENIRLNNGQSSVSEEHINIVCRKILEEAGRSYIRRGTNSSANRCRSLTPDVPDNLSDAGSSVSVATSNTRERDSNIQLPFSRLKRKPQSDTESESGSVSRRKPKKGRYGGSGHGPSNLAREPVKREGPRWNPERLTIQTQIIMGPKANKALGLGAARGRIYMKHPEVFKYSCDADDKQWLYENHKLPASGGKVYLMLLDDVTYLAESPEYKNTPTEKQYLKGFPVPQFMIDKMKQFMASQRTDVPPTIRSAPRGPINKSILSVAQQEGQGYDVDSDKNLPFTTAASSRRSLNESKFSVNSPANTEELELMSSEEMDEAPVSPFGSADDYAPVSPNNANSTLKPSLNIGLQDVSPFGIP